MVIIALGEAVKTLDKLSGKKLLPHIHPLNGKLHWITPSLTLL